MDGEIHSIAFKIILNARFHDVGVFVSECESGPFTLELRQISIASKTTSSPILHVELEGTAYLLASRL
jgi:Tfp pilus assembly protein PilO